MVYKPKKSIGGLLGLVVGIIVFGFAIWGINFSLEESDRVLKLMLLVPTYIFAIGYAYLLLGAFIMSYRVDDSGVTINWGIHKRRIPLSAIDEVVDIKGRANLFPFLATAWKGYMFGLYSGRGIGSLKMYATQPEDGFVLLKTKQGQFGVNPADEEGFLKDLAGKVGKGVQTIDMDTMDPEVYGKAIHKDEHFALFMRLNQIFLAILAILIGAFFPGSGAPPMIVLLMVLALALYAFNAGNAKRLYQFSPSGADITLLIALMVNGIFIILTVVGIWFV
ncbi:MAG TPA: PH domain-containing protein [Syntrophomonadaceae bacterium]|nr:PH domain-containing protein [Syntrophomonadaceae bacterium]